MAFQKILLVFLNLSFFVVFAYEKHWTLSNNWNLPSNWNPPELPCQNDRISISEGVVFIDSNATFPSEIEKGTSQDVDVKNQKLPMNGELIFGDNLEITLGHTSPETALPGSCVQSGSDLTYVGQQGEKDWLNPTHWEFVTANGRKDQYKTQAAPYIDRIPCTNDIVSFPQGDAFDIDIKNDIKVHQLKLSSQIIWFEEQLESYLTTAEGKLRFKMASPQSSLSIVPQETCDLRSGCMCGYERSRDQICAAFQCPSTCQRKVLPHGDCCYRCGAILKFSPGVDFEFEKCHVYLKALSDSEANATTLSPVFVFLSVIETNKLQLLITHPHNGSAAEQMLNVIRNTMEANAYAPCNGKDFESITWNNSSAGKINKGSTNSVAIIATSIVVPVLIVVLVIALVAVIRRRRSFDPPHKEFKNDDVMSYPGIADVEYATTDFVEEYRQDGGVSFTNPAYGVSHETTKQPVNEEEEGEKEDAYDIPVAPIGITSRFSGFENAFENPAYQSTGLYDTLDGTIDEEFKDHGPGNDHHVVQIPPLLENNTKPKFNLDDQSNIPKKRDDVYTPDDVNNDVIPDDVKSIEEIEEDEEELGDTIEGMKPKLEIHLGNDDEDDDGDEKEIKGKTIKNESEA